jgi:formate hydrogenlyase subunit 6/NADH:ubiquinone oxidoreductase subunit I
MASKVQKKKLVLSFPPSLVEDPFVYRLIKDFDLEVNILRATVTPRNWGRMVLEVKGGKANLNKAYDYLEESGVQLDSMVQEMRHLEERCVHCTACTAVCPTQALTVVSQSREVHFEPSKCIICESCIPTCSYGALESQF